VKNRFQNSPFKFNLQRYSAGGMARMIRDGGLLSEFGPKPTSAFALHIWPYPYAPTGLVLGKPGPIMVGLGCTVSCIQLVVPLALALMKAKAARLFSTVEPVKPEMLISWLQSLL
jgi:hypothetical protein